MDNKLLKYRYPGVNTFTEDDTDIFCGRAEDGERLYMQIMLNKTVVLHAESGTGKSSLVNAGLLPLIKKNNPEYIPLYVRFKGIRKKDGKNLDINEEGDNVLVHEILKALKSTEQLKASALPLIEPTKKDLWYEAKLYQANQKSLLFIFDQFEDLQIYSYNQIQRFKEELALIFSSAIPEKHYQALVKKTPVFADDPEGEQNFRKKYNEVIKVLREPLNARALFVIREDKLGTLSLLSDCFPDIFKNDYLLMPLKYDNAWKAIEEPAKTEGDHFVSPKFEFEKDAIKSLLKKLCNAATYRVDPIEIQIICMHIENNICEESSKKKLLPDELIVTKDKLKSVKDIITTFYFDCWRKVKGKLSIPDTAYNKKRRLITDELVFEDKKIQVFSGHFSEEDNQILEELVLTGLLRKVPFNNEMWYQLSHDKLVKPVIEDLSKLKAAEEIERKTEEARQEAERKANEVKKEAENARIEAEARAREERMKLQNKLIVKRRTSIILGIFSIILIIFLIVVIRSWHDAKIANAKAQEQQYLVTSRAIKNSNPTLSYLIATDWLTNANYSPDQEFTNYINAYDSAVYSYMIASFTQISPSIVSAQYVEKDSETVVVDNNYVYVWDKKGLLKKRNSILNNRTIVKSFQIGSESYLIVYHNEDLEITKKYADEKTKKFKVNNYLETVINTSAISSVSNFITVSNNGKWILLGNTIYDFKSRKVLCVLPDLPEYSLKTIDQRATSFLSDNAHIAIGYVSGDIAIFNLDEKNKKEKVKLVKPFKRIYMNSPVMSIAIDNQNKYLFAGNEDGSITRWEIGGLDKDEYYNFNAINLVGHEGPVNCMAISPDGQTILTGSDDHSAILWDIQTGKRLSVLKGRNSKVNYVGFSDLGKIMITGSEDGRVFLWKKQKVSKFGEDELALFCPFDYYATGMEQYNIGDVYDTTGVEKSFSSTIHYLSNLPDVNAYPEDPNYLKSLDRSLVEAKSMYQKLTINKGFYNSISANNKWILFNYYMRLFEKEPELLLRVKDETKEEKYRRFGDFYDSRIKALLLDTTDVVVARSIATQYSIWSSYFFDSLKNYKKGIEFSQKRKDLLKSFNEKFPQDSILRQDLSTAYWELSWQCIFDNKYDSTIEYAQKGLDLCPKNNGINTNLALGYLLRRKFGKAEAIYTKYKDSTFLTNSSRHFGESFLEDFEDLEKQGIISSKNQEVYQKVLAIKAMLRNK